MKQVTQSMPTANIAINKSRLKVYQNNGDVPTYYLQKGQEFQIELFNPTNKKILAKISLNNMLITQGGLVLNPGQRVFLDRYIDVAKKFRFDTYEVSNTAEVKEAIRDNGDFKVQFFREEEPKPYYGNLRSLQDYWHNGPIYGSAGVSGGYVFNSPTTLNASIGLTNLTTNNSTTLNVSNASYTSDVTLDSLNSMNSASSALKKSSPVRSKKSIETGRVEAGSASDQKLETVNYNFESWAFHTITYKMLPVSQKVNTVQDIQVKKYCTECGAKQKPTNKFCPSCGAKV